MAKDYLDRKLWEDFKLGSVYIKGRHWGGIPSNGGQKWSFFTKAGEDQWLLGKTARKASYAPKSWEQKSIAKVSYMKNIYPDQWRVHGHYLARQGAQLEDKPGLGFNSENEDLNISKILSNWQKDGDPRLWKIIISPEMSHKLDLKEHIRAVMQGVGKDLGSKLEWVAVDHYNTDNHHAHVVIRGITEGKELKLSQEYFTQGFRLRSSQEATRTLGLRTERDIVLKRHENIRAMYLTDMDGEIKRRLNNNNFIILDHFKKPFGYEKELQLKGRLMLLEEMGLAKRGSSVSWWVDSTFCDHLKFLQTQRNIVKAKNKHIKNMLNPDLPVVMDKLDWTINNNLKLERGRSLRLKPNRGGV